MKMWSEIELNLRSRTECLDSARKFCAYCGHQDPDLLGRCYGCQMIYYCSQEHQHLDWIEKHMPRCAELEWAALCQIMESIPIDLSPVYCNSPWIGDNQVATWTDWFELRSDLVDSIRQLSKTIHEEIFTSKNLVLNRRQPQLNDVLDGILARVTQIMSFPITIGSCLKSLNISPDSKPLCIHILYPPLELFDDLVANFINGDLEDLEFCVKKKFYEILNMFPHCTNSIEFVLISTNCYLNTANFDQTAKTELIDWSKFIQSPVLRKDFDLLRSKRGVFVSAWQGSYSNYIKYACNNSDGFLEPDLVVAFDPSLTKSPQKLITDWTDELKIILTSSYSCLFTFSDRLELDKAFNILNAFQTNIVSCQSNQFSSLVFRQDDPTKPNNVHSTNAFFILLKGFSSKNSIDPRQKTGAESLISRSKSINDLLKYHIQTDACVQTIGLNEPENPSLRHIKGKIQISKAHLNRTSDLNGDSITSTLDMIDIFIDNREKENTKQVPSLEFASCPMPEVDYDAKIDYSIHLKATPRKSLESRYYQPRKLIRPEINHECQSAFKPLTKPRNQLNEETVPQVKPRSVLNNENSITSTESNIKSELEAFCSTSSSSNLSTSSSNRSSSSSSVSAPSSVNQPCQGIVSQMRNIFESPEKTKNTELITNRKKLFNNYESALVSIKKQQPLYENLNFMQSDRLVDLGVAPCEAPPPPLPLSPPPEEPESTPKLRLLSDTSSSTNCTLKSDFKILSTERSITPCSKSMYASQNLLIKDIPDSVDEVRLEYEGQRHVVVPGYMTSADILRNILLKNNSSLPVNLKKSEPTETLKQKLIKLNEKDEECLRKKFNQNSKPRVISGEIKLEKEQVIDIDFDFRPAKPPRTFEMDVNLSVEEKMNSVRTVSSRGSLRKPKCITGSFDPNDFDSFDEDEFEPVQSESFIPIEPLDKIMGDALDKQKIELDLQKQNENLVQFDADDFDSFDEEYFDEETKCESVNAIQASKQEYQSSDIQEREKMAPIQQSSGFFRSAIDRLSVKSRSLSVPVRGSEKPIEKATNQKTVNLMNRIQSQVEEKQKIKKEKRSKKLEDEKKKLNDQTHKKSLTSLLSFFSSSNQISTDMVKNENKRLSLRRLKAKKKAKADNFDCQSDFDSRSNRSFNLDSEGEENLDLKRSLFNQARSSGRIKNEMIDKKQNLKSDLMVQLRAELDEEIKGRIEIEKKQEIIQSSNFRRSSIRESISSKKIRSKSVTFLDELSSEDESNFQSSNCLQESSETRPSLRAGDARMFAGALTGAGPVRSIIKKSVNDIGVIDNLTERLPIVNLHCLDDEFNLLRSMQKSQTTPNFKRKEQFLQSDL